jgi:hypothetical protein
MLTKLFNKCVFKSFLSASLALAACTHIVFADASSLFKQLAGSWRGLGDVTLADGTRERISCRGYYVLKSGGAGLSLAILCNSPNRELEIRSRVQESARRITGQWEERTFNAMGEVSGSVTGNNLNLSFTGSMAGSISISIKGRRHTVRISTTGTGFKAVSISLMRG